ncbi:MAG: hypothetical protein A3G93_04045 [Nitrospinae bacterium RIFCSPLOWO2_12_FULL_45_22]|nr:MAG: hypothetical protein A3G93_04045 [Nitrospinae bacterium RIFCSPLOWO2_12_FULL_45_22]
MLFFIKLFFRYGAGPWLRSIVYSKRIFGDKSWQVMLPLMTYIGQKRAPLLQTELNIDVNDMSSLAKIQDWEDQLAGVKGEWVERGPKRAIKRERECPFSELLKSCPEFCTHLAYELERATFQTLNPTYRLEKLEALLSKGDSYCEFIHQID